MSSNLYNMSITLEQLQKIMPNGGLRVANAYPHVVKAADKWGINTPARMAAWLAQMAHECGEFRWMSEIWGPTPAQLRYEPVTSLSIKLGNTQKGDGYLYRGSGPFQLTGKSNFIKFGKLVGQDLVNNPDLARGYAIGLDIAGAYWVDKKLNDLADKGDFIGITKAINGGTNGLDARIRYYNKAKEVLGVI